MSYLVFARKFRPQDFESVIGQAPIVTTLKNAIQQERIPQSFLFSGPRGIGKTSTARILAKAINCVKGPTLEPCGKCTACIEITQGNSLDVLEIDGASNRGIDEIRNLRETVKFKPTSGRYKVYIIDEVHMLTPEAFNALLKTLEEPPPHVKFIFATTESHKVPLTILSRCQRFQFKRIPIPEIVKKLEEIAGEEKIKHDKNALFLIAKASEGSLRDAESLLDQLASFSEGKIREEDVLLMLGMPPETLYLDVLDALRSKDAQKIFFIVHELYEGGKDLVQFAKGLLEVFRHLLLFQSTNKAEEFVEMGEESKTALKQKAGDFSKGELLLGLSLLGNLQHQLRRNLAPPKLLVETLLLKLLSLDGLQSVEKLMSGTTAAQPDRPQAAFATPVFRRPVENPRAAPQASLVVTPEVPNISSEEASLSSFAPGSATAVQTLESESCWPRVIEYVKSKRMSTGIFLSESTPIEIGESAVTLGLPAEFQFHKETLEKDSNRQIVQEAFEVVTGKKMHVQFVITRPDTTDKPGKAGPAAVSDPKLPEIITKAMDIFEGARIIRKE